MPAVFPAIVENNANEWENLPHGKQRCFTLQRRYVNDEERTKRIKVSKLSYNRRVNNTNTPGQAVSIL